MKVLCRQMNGKEKRGEFEPGIGIIFVGNTEINRMFLNAFA